jgi:hypothetical protein
MRQSPTTHSMVLWMEYDGDIYSPETSLGRATRENFEDDIWRGEYPGVCHAVYSYGTYPNGGSYCREITLEIASGMTRRSFEQEIEPIPAVCAFLEAAGEVWFKERREGVISPRLIQMREEIAPARSRAKRRKGAKKASPEELRAQPQFKLPIAGGKKKADSPSRPNDKEVLQSGQGPGRGSARS